MDLNHLTVFVAVAETGSFTEAASRLDVTKSSVSRAITALEGTLGVRLLHRTTRTVALSTAGRALYERMGPRLQSLQDALADVPELEAEPSGSLRVTATADFGTEVLAEILTGFGRRYPRVRVEVVLTSRTVDLVKERFDVAFRMADGLKDSRLVARRLGSLTLHLYAAPSYLAARGTPRRPGDFAAHDWVMLPSMRGISLQRAWRISLPENPRLVADDMFFVREALCRGAGLGALPTYLVDKELREGRLVRVMPRWTLLNGSIYLVMPSAQHLPRKTVVFRDHVVEALRQRLPAGEG
ncbi:LysR family transcriptional regulator [Corallococcus sp. H22C18031201]|uniref:LysR family transcriptional regulator n=1 Tax=Citreicoccus inhibens TaxID=2849499 RepID=UPI000E7600E8|nr:LysR family transcriptional regulator [Citreicoccus inhibens]MBU8895186.1 LysR family transcriptional regulator [Citreicoccus inhibens]RJS27322.1 LysR family transcriptional regulator [Corallococcus sp. H22C18031201]